MTVKIDSEWSFTHISGDYEHHKGIICETEFNNKEDALDFAKSQIKKYGRLLDSVAVCSDDGLSIIGWEKCVWHQYTAIIEP